MGRSLSESNQPQQLAREIKISLGELSVEMQRSIRTCLIPLQASQEGVAQEALVQLQERMGMSHRIYLVSHRLRIVWLVTFSLALPIRSNSYRPR